MTHKKTDNIIRPVLRRYIRIMLQVVKGEYSVTEIANLTCLHRSTVSRYLKIIAEEIPEIEHSYEKRGGSGGRGGFGKYYRWVR